MTSVRELSLRVDGRRVLHPLAHLSAPDLVADLTMVDGAAFARLHALRQHRGPAGRPVRLDPDTVVRIPDALTSDLCAAIIARAEHGLDGLAGDDGASRGWSPIAATMTHPDDEFARAIVDFAVGMIAGANRSTWHLDPLNVTSVQVIRYLPGEGKAWHADGAFDPSLAWVAVIVALTDVDGYEGGELEVRGAEPEKLPQGCAVVVPGHLRHRVLPVIAGTRWMLTAFAAQPRTVDAAVNSAK